ncbi:MAG: glycosyl hydrolase family 28-related protein, partial [Candidatus Methanomethylicaceae archaeon]
MKHLVRKEQVEGARRYNVLDYGINSSANDNTARLNDLIQEVYDKGGGEIYFPAGTYKFGGTIRLNSNIILNGDGWNTILLQTGTGNLIQIGDENLPVDVWFGNIKISNLFLTCNNPNNGGSGIILYGTTGGSNDASRYTVSKIIFDSLRIENFGYAGINVDWVLIDVFYHRLWVTKNGRFGIKVGVDCDVMSCFVGENGRKYPNDFYNCGILVAGADTRISNCHVWGWGQEKGILIEWSGDIQILGCIIEEHSKEGIYIKNSSTTRIIGNYLEDNSYGNNGVYSAIKIVGDYENNPSVHTFIIGNRFGKQIWGGFETSHKYCVEEEGDFVDFTTFQDNYVYKGYTDRAVKFVGSNSREIGNIDEIEKGFSLYNAPNLGSLFRFRQRPSTRASEANFIVKSYPGRAGLQVVRDMRGNPYRGHAFEFATIYDDPYPTGGQTATGVRFMVGHSADDDTADVYPLVRLYAIRNDSQYRSELAEGTGILLFQLNATGQTDWDGGHISTKFVMYPTGWLGVNTDRPVTHLDVNGDFALKHVKVMYYSSSNNRLDIGDASGSGNPQLIRLKGVTEIGKMFKLSNSSFSDFAGISYTSHTHGTDVLNGIGIYGKDNALRILFPTQVNMQSPHPNSILFIQGDNDEANRIFRNDDTGFIAIVGGWSSTRNASISVFGNDNTSYYGGINLVLGANSNASLRIYKADGNGGFNELMRVTSDGYVGINTH